MQHIQAQLTNLLTIDGQWRRLIDSQRRYIGIHNTTGKLELWDLQRQTQQGEIPKPDHLSPCSIHPSGQHITVLQPKTLLNVDVHTGKIIQTMSVTQDHLDFMGNLYDTPHAIPPMQRSTTMITHSPCGQWIWLGIHQKQKPVLQLRNAYTLEVIDQFDHIGDYRTQPVWGVTRPPDRDHDLALAWSEAWMVTEQAHPNRITILANGGDSFAYGLQFDIQDQHICLKTPQAIADAFEHFTGGEFIYAYKVLDDHRNLLINRDHHFTIVDHNMNALIASSYPQQHIHNEDDELFIPNLDEGNQAAHEHDWLDIGDVSLWRGILLVNLDWHPNAYHTAAMMALDLTTLEPQAVFHLPNPTWQYGALHHLGSGRVLKAEHDKVHIYQFEVSS